MSIPGKGYFCVFCYKFHSNERTAIEAHLKDHLNDPTQGLELESDVTIFQDKWITHHINDQESFFRANRDLSNGYRVANYHFNRIVDGCPLCDIYMNKYGIHPGATKSEVDFAKPRRALKVIYTHTLKHMSFLNFCSACDFKEAKPIEVERHINRSDDADHQDSRMLARTLLPRINTFIIQYVHLFRASQGAGVNRDLITLDSKIFWKKAEERQFFCVFCPELRFSEFNRIESHLKDHLDYDSKTGYQKQYLTNWLTDHLNLQEEIFSANSKPQQYLVLNSARHLEYRYQVWEGCVVCEILCNIFNYIPEIQFIMVPRDTGLKRYKVNLHSHIRLHLRCGYYCSSCSFKKNKATALIKKHIRDVHHNDGSFILRCSLEPKFKKLVSSYLKIVRLIIE